MSMLSLPVPPQPPPTRELGGLAGSCLREELRRAEELLLAGGLSSNPGSCPHPQRTRTRTRTRAAAPSYNSVHQSAAESCVGGLARQGPAHALPDTHSLGARGLQTKLQHPRRTRCWPLSYVSCCSRVYARTVQEEGGSGLSPAEHPQCSEAGACP